MKVALITSTKYGLTQFVLRDVEALRANGHTVPLFVLVRGRGLYEPPAGSAVSYPSLLRAVLRFGALLLTRPRSIARLLLHALRHRSLADLVVALSFLAEVALCDVIYAYFGDHKFFVGYYCKQLSGVPLAVTIRAYELYNNPNPRLFREALEDSDAVVTITEHNRSILAESYGLAPSRVDVVRQIVDLETLRYVPRLKILIVGFFAEKKGHEILFRALKKLNRRDLELWVVGDTNPSVLEVDCRSLAAELDLIDRVAFFGAQSGTALWALYRECDIFCLPSRTDRTGNREGFPNAIAEAMAFGKPVVSTYHAGIPEALEELLVEENDVDALAGALAEACDSAELRRRAGERNRRVAEQMFGPRNNLELARILERCTGVSPAQESHAEAEVSSS